MQLLRGFNGFVDALPKWIIALVSVAVGIGASTALEALKDRRARMYLQRALCKEVASIYFHVVGAQSVFTIPGEDPIANPRSVADLNAGENFVIDLTRSDLTKRLHLSAYKYAQSNASLYYRLRKLEHLVAIYYTVDYLLDFSRKMTGNVFRTMMSAVVSAIERAVTSGTFTKTELKHIDDTETCTKFLSLLK